MEDRHNARIVITPELAIAAGKIATTVAETEPDSAITIEWTGDEDGAPENVWAVRTDAETFWINDETGEHV